MTSNQIAREKLLEERRHNYATEDLSRDSNEIAALNAGVNWKNAETNLLTANIRQQEATLRGQELYETVRHNYAIESENQRHNVAQENVNLLQTYEAQRANVARETETQRSNIAAEDLRYQQNVETQRHNEAGEQLEGSSIRAGILGGLINTVGNLIGRFAR